MVVTVGQVMAWGLAGVLVLSGLTKARPASHADFKDAVHRLVSPRAGALSVPIVLAELVTAAALLVPSWTPVGLALAGLLLVAFTLVLVSAALRGVEASCQCFGALSRESAVGPRPVVRNLLLTALVIGALATQKEDVMSSAVALWIALAVTFVVAGAALAAVVFLVVGLRRLGIPVGDNGIDGHGVMHEDEQLFEAGAHLDLPGGDGRQTIVAVLSTTCPVCVQAAAVLEQTAARTDAGFVALVDDRRPGSPDLMRELERLGCTRILMSDRPDLVPLTEIRPGYAVIDESGHVLASGTGYTELALQPAHG